MPLASFSVTTAWVVCPTVRLLLFNVTVTVATGTSATVTVAEPDTPSLVAVITEVPGVTAVTKPALEMVATLVVALV